MNRTTYFLHVVLGGVVLATFIFSFSLLNEGVRSLAPIETIKGIDYPRLDSGAQIYEALAHSDLALLEPAFGKNVDLTVAFTPHDIEHLSIGIRRNSFWLSYEMIPLYSRTNASDPEQSILRRITIPLTDKLQDKDRSLDVMFFADTTKSSGHHVIDPATLIGQQVYWELETFEAAVVNTTPSPLATVNYLASILTRERAL